MFTSTPKKITIGILAASLFLLSLSGCGSSAYVKAITPIIEQFNLAVDSVNTQMNALIKDTMVFEDAGWQNATKTALSNWNGASQALLDLPEPEKKFSNLNAMVLEMAKQAILAADAYKAAIQAGDITLMNNGSPFLDKVKSLLPQINAEMDRLNQ
jgi:outer membrane murein-binding lipoprotein Lpp